MQTRKGTDTSVSVPFFQSPDDEENRKSRVDRVEDQGPPIRLCNVYSLLSHLNSLRQRRGGGEGSRTLDLSIANAALSQLSYAPSLFPLSPAGWNLGEAAEYRRRTPLKSDVHWNHDDTTKTV